LVATIAFSWPWWWCFDRRPLNSWFLVKVSSARLIQIGCRLCFWKVANSLHLYKSDDIVLQ
jgi:hypothetical protein